MTVIEESITASAQAVENDSGRVAEMRALAAGLPTVLPSETMTPATVSDIVTDEFSISFEVDEIGKPVLFARVTSPTGRRPEPRGRIGCRRTSWSSSRPIRRSSSATDARASNSSVSCSRSSASPACSRASDPGRDRWPTVGPRLVAADLLPSRDLVLAEVQGPGSLQRRSIASSMRPRNARGGRGRARGRSCARRRHPGAAPGCRAHDRGAVGVVARVASRHRWAALGRVRPRPSLVDLARYRSTVVEPSRVLQPPRANDQDPDGST